MVLVVRTTCNTVEPFCYKNGGHKITTAKAGIATNGVSFGGFGCFVNWFGFTVEIENSNSSSTCPIEYGPWMYHSGNYL